MKNIILTLIAFSIASIGYSQNLVIKGSDTLGAKLVPTLAEEYKTINKGTVFQIAAEGSSTGIAAIIEGTADIGMSSRRVKPTEVSLASSKGVTLKPIIVAYDGMAIIVSDKNPISKLTRRQVEQIFSGDITNWSVVGGNPAKISVYTRNTSSGTYSDFKELAMKNRDYSKTSQKLAGNEQILSEVSKNPNGIGYVGLAYIKASNIKVVPIDVKLPTIEDINAKSYPYARPTFYYVNSSPTEAAQKFVEFTLSAKGKQIMERMGFIAPQ